MLGDIWSNGDGIFYIDMCNPKGREKLTIGVYPASTKTKVNYLGGSTPIDFLAHSTSFLVGNIVDILLNIEDIKDED